MTLILVFLAGVVVGLFLGPLIEQALYVWW